jgi:hypothetical protein
MKTEKDQAWIHLRLRKGGWKEVKRFASLISKDKTLKDFWNLDCPAGASKIIEKKQRKTGNSKIGSDIFRPRAAMHASSSERRLRAHSDRCCNLHVRRLFRDACLTLTWPPRFRDISFENEQNQLLMLCAAAPARLQSLMCFDRAVVEGTKPLVPREFQIAIVHFKVTVMHLVVESSQCQ